MPMAMAPKAEPSERRAALRSRRAAKRMTRARKSATMAAMRRSAPSAPSTAATSSISNAEVREDDDAPVAQLHAQRVLVAAEFVRRARRERLGIDIAEARGKRLPGAKRRDAPLRAADLGGDYLVALGVVGIGNDAQAQPIEEQILVARLVAAEVLLAHHSLRLQRPELAQLGVGLGQLERVGARVARHLLDEMRNVAARPGGQRSEREQDKKDGGPHGPHPDTTRFRCP